MQDEELGSMWVDHLLTITNHMMKLGHQVEHLQMCYHQTPIMILIAHCNHLQDLKASILISNCSKPDRECWKSVSIFDFGTYKQEQYIH